MFFSFFSHRDRSVLHIVLLRIKQMQESLEQLTNRVTEIENTADSAIELLNGISQQLKDAIAANDPAAIQALSDRLAAQTQELADAIVANTPADDADPGPVPDPPEPTDPDAP